MSREEAVTKLILRVLTVILSCSLATASWAQSKPAPVPSQSPSSVGEELQHADGKEIHIFYIHGIGSYGPDDRDSAALRKSICDYLKDCTTPGGTAIGEWDYADQNQFG